MSGGRAAYFAVAGDPSAPEHERVFAEFFHAYSYVQQNRYEDARREFRLVIERYVNQPAYEATVNGARKQLELMDRHDQDRAKKKQ